MARKTKAQLKAAATAKDKARAAVQACQIDIRTLSGVASAFVVGRLLGSVVSGEEDVFSGVGVRSVRLMDLRPAADGTCPRAAIRDNHLTDPELVPGLLFGLEGLLVIILELRLT